MLQPAEAPRRTSASCRARGRPRWIEVSLVPHLDDDGALVGAFVLISDITHHRLAEPALRESEERLAKFMQASVEGIVFHSDGVITDVNPPMVRAASATRATKCSAARSSSSSRPTTSSACAA